MIKSDNQVVQKLNFTVDVDELKEYYEILKNNYQDWHWTWEKNSIHLDNDARNACGDLSETLMNGWPLQSDMADKKLPPSMLKSKHPKVPWYNTELMFGPMTRLYEKMPYAYRWTMFVLPPGGRVVRHVDKDQYVIVIPIQWAKEATFTLDDTPYSFDSDGSAYLLDVEVPHDTINNSDKDRINLIARIDRNRVDDILKITGKI
jgi:hypothetical protein